MSVPGKATYIHLELEYPDNSGISRMGSVAAQLAAKSFWGAEMLRQRLDEVARATSRPLQGPSLGFPSLRRHSRASTASPTHSAETSDCDSRSSGTDSPLLPARKRAAVKPCRRSSLGSVYSARETNDFSSPNSDSSQDSLQPLPAVRLGSKEAKLASTSFWGQHMLQQRCEDITTQQRTVPTSPQTPYLPPVAGNLKSQRPRSSFARMPRSTTEPSLQSTAAAAPKRKALLQCSTNSSITPVAF